MHSQIQENFINFYSNCLPLLKVLYCIQIHDNFMTHLFSLTRLNILSIALGAIPGNLRSLSPIIVKVQKSQGNYKSREKISNAAYTYSCRGVSTGFCQRCNYTLCPT